MFGFLNINKPVGMTSFAVIAKLRKILGIKKIGHAGTLDPFAQGVLPIAIGKATRLLDFLSNEKSYIATIKFGADTDTYDIDGQIVRTYDKKVSIDDIKNVLPKFSGKFLQVPPKYSAIKINGKKLCDMARKGEEIEEIKPRKIEIKNIEILDFDFTKQILKIHVDCLKGTYIRSLAYDIGQELNCGAYLTQLIRTNSSGFLIENSHILDESEKLKEYILNPLEYLNLPLQEITNEQYKKIKYGQTITIEKENIENLILIYEQELVAIGNLENKTFTISKQFISLV